MPEKLALVCVKEKCSQSSESIMSAAFLQDNKQLGKLLGHFLMIRWQVNTDVDDFERDLVVGVREIGHYIS